MDHCKALWDIEGVLAGSIQIFYSATMTFIYSGTSDHKGTNLVLLKSKIISEDFLSSRSLLFFLASLSTELHVAISRVGEKRIYKLYKDDSQK